jgi:AcrR family transcriptional regulator
MIAYADLLEEHRTERRALLLAKAAEAIDTHGLRSVTINAIADHAGISKVVFYRYFGSKAGLIDAVLADVVEALLGLDEMPVEWWTDRLPHTLALAREMRHALRVLLRQAPNDPHFGRHLDHLHAVMATRTARRIEQALGAPTGSAPSDTAMLTRLISSFLLDAYLRWVDEGDPEREQAFLAWIIDTVRFMTRRWCNAPIEAT